MGTVPFIFLLGVQFSSLNIGGIESGSMQLSSQSPVIPMFDMPFLCCWVGFVWQSFCNRGYRGAFCEKLSEAPPVLDTPLAQSKPISDGGRAFGASELQRRRKI